MPVLNGPVRRTPGTVACAMARANMTLCFPSAFLLVAAMNPCPCMSQLNRG